MKEDKIVNGYYESKIKTSRKEDSVYAIKYASQQMIIDKLETNWKELKKWLEEQLKRYQTQFAASTTELEDKLNYERCYICRNTLDKMQELESNKVGE